MNDEEQSRTVEGITLSPGDVHKGWTYLGIQAMPEGPPALSTHFLTFKRGADVAVLFNGQGAGAKFALKNGRIALCPQELQIFVGATYGG